MTISNIFKPVVATADGPVDEITQTVMTKSTIRQLETENERLKRRPTNTDAIYDWETYQEKPDMVQFYTGLINYGVLCVLYKYIEAHLNQFRYCMPKKRQLLVVLIKLRMNYLFQDMAYRLNVSVSTIQRVFHETLTVMYYRLSFLLKWPARDQLRKSDPYCFRQAFGDKVTVVIDCFELMAETPKGAKNQIFTYSSYKHHQTIKYLIGISPQGVIIFLSKGWGGRAHDQHITHNERLLENLLPGDVFMADRGFNIGEEVSYFQAKLVIPGFTKGKLQLHPIEVEHTRKVASVRIHVERVIGLLLRKFRVFDGVIRIDFFKTDEDFEATIDKIVHVGAYLTNLCSSVVPFE